MQFFEIYLNADAAKKLMLEDTQDYISIIQKHKRQRAMKSKL